MQRGLVLGPGDAFLHYVYAPFLLRSVRKEHETYLKPTFSKAPKLPNTEVFIVCMWTVESLQNESSSLRGSQQGMTPGLQ